MDREWKKEGFTEDLQRRFPSSFSILAFGKKETRKTKSLLDIKFSLFSL